MCVRFSPVFVLRSRIQYIVPCKNDYSTRFPFSTDTHAYKFMYVWHMSIIFANSVLSRLHDGLLLDKHCCCACVSFVLIALIESCYDCLGFVFNFTSSNGSCNGTKHRLLTLRTNTQRHTQTSSANTTGDMHWKPHLNRAEVHKMFAYIERSQAHFRSNVLVA